MQVVIVVEVDEGDPSADPEHHMGITSEAYDRLTDPAMGTSLRWLGEVVEVRREA
jgi:hypothetical protein